MFLAKSRIRVGNSRPGMIGHWLSPMVIYQVLWIWVHPSNFFKMVDGPRFMPILNITLIGFLMIWMIGMHFSSRCFGLLLWVNLFRWHLFRCWFLQEALGHSLGHLSIHNHFIQLHVIVFRKMDLSVKTRSELFVIWSFNVFITPLEKGQLMLSFTHFEPFF